MAPQAGFIGSPTNIIMVVTTTLFLAAGRFGLAPTANRNSTVSLELKAGACSPAPDTLAPHSASALASSLQEYKDGNSFTSDPGGV